MDTITPGNRVNASTYFIFTYFILTPFYRTFPRAAAPVFSLHFIIGARVMFFKRVSFEESSFLRV